MVGKQDGQERERGGSIQLKPQQRPKRQTCCCCCYNAFAVAHWDWTGCCCCCESFAKKIFLFPLPHNLSLSNAPKSAPGQSKLPLLSPQYTQSKGAKGDFQEAAAATARVISYRETKREKERRRRRGLGWERCLEQSWLIRFTAAAEAAASAATMG